jgi:hypothetical protein
MGCAAPNSLHWQDLRSRPASRLAEQGGVRTADGGATWEVPFLNARYRVDPAAERIVELEPDPERPLEQDFQILLLRYLMAPPGGGPSGQEVSEKELPGGATFFRGPHELQVHPVLQRYAGDLEGFESRGRELGAEVRDLGDRALRFEPFPGIPVTLVLWRADEEFPASMSVLFDRSILRWFELDMIFLLVGILARRMVGR